MIAEETTSSIHFSRLKKCILTKEVSSDALLERVVFGQKNNTSQMEDRQHACVEKSRFVTKTGKM